MISSEGVDGGHVFATAERGDAAAEVELVNEGFEFVAVLSVADDKEPGGGKFGQDAGCSTRRKMSTPFSMESLPTKTTIRRLIGVGVVAQGRTYVVEGLNIDSVADDMDFVWADATP